MQNAFAASRLPDYLVARAAAMHFAVNSFPAFGNGRTQIFAQVEAAAMAQATGADEMEHGLRRLKVRAVPETMSPRDDFMIKVKEIHGQGFQLRIHNRQAG